MIALSVENMTVEEFLHTINTHKFYPPSEFDLFINDFLSYYKQDVIDKCKKGETIKQRASERERERLFNERYNAEMSKLEDIMFYRREHLERIEVKNRYRGKYKNKKYGNTKRKAQVDKS